MMITKQFYFDLSGKNFCQKILRSKNFKQKLRHQVMEAEAIQKLLLPHSWLNPFILFLIFKFKFKSKFIDFNKTRFKFKLIDLEKTKIKFIDLEKTKIKFIDFAKVEFKFNFINNS